MTSFQRMNGEQGRKEDSRIEARICRETHPGDNQIYEEKVGELGEDKKRREETTTRWLKRKKNASLFFFRGEVKRREERKPAW